MKIGARGDSCRDRREPRAHSPDRESGSLEAVGDGEISPSEGQAISALLGQQRQAFEAVELSERLEAMPEDDPGVIRVEIVGNPEHTRQIAKAAEEAARKGGKE